MTPADYEGALLGCALAFIVFALVVAGWIRLEWEWSKPDREKRKGTGRMVRH